MASLVEAKAAPLVGKVTVTPLQSPDAIWIAHVIAHWRRRGTVKADIAHVIIANRTQAQGIAHRQISRAHMSHAHVRAHTVAHAQTRVRVRGRLRIIKSWW